MMRIYSLRYTATVFIASTVAVFSLFATSAGPAQAATYCDQIITQRPVYSAPGWNVHCVDVVHEDKPNIVGEARSGPHEVVVSRKATNALDVLAHELSHAWAFDNMPTAVQQQFSKSLGFSSFRDGDYPNQPTEIWADSMSRCAGYVNLGPRTVPCSIVNQYVQISRTWQYSYGDVSGDSRAELVGISNQNSLVVGGGSSFTLGTGFSGVTWLSKASSVDKHNFGFDVITVHNNGNMFYTKRLTTGTTITQIGSGWGSQRLIAMTPDVTGDGQPDLIAVQKDTGTLYRYSFDAQRRIVGAAVAIGRNWQGMKEIAAVDDISGDGVPDLIAVDAVGGLWRYNLAGGTAGTATSIGHGWLGFKDLVAVGDWNHSGRWDVIARRKSDGAILAWTNWGKGLNQAGVVPAGVFAGYQHVA